MQGTTLPKRKPLGWGSIWVLLYVENYVQKKSHREGNKALWRLFWE